MHGTSAGSPCHCRGLPLWPRSAAGRAPRQEAMRCAQDGYGNAMCYRVLESLRGGLITGAISIVERPIEVAERLVPGHWEGDLIKGARNQPQIGTLVERKTLYTVLVQMGNATAEHTSQRFGFDLVLNRLDAAMRQSMP